MPIGEGDLQLFSRVALKTERAKDLRDRSILALLALQGLRIIEIERACGEDHRGRGDVTKLRVRGKGRDRLVCLRPDVAQLLAAYLGARPA